MVRDTVAGKMTDTSILSIKVSVKKIKSAAQKTVTLMVRVK